MSASMFGDVRSSERLVRFIMCATLPLSGTAQSLETFGSNKVVYNLKKCLHSKYRVYLFEVGQYIKRGHFSRVALGCSLR